MKQHATDLVALVFGVAFAIAGAVTVVTQRTSVDVGPEWAFALVAIAVGSVILLVTIARSRREPVEATVSAASSDASDDLGEG